MFFHKLRLFNLKILSITLLKFSFLITSMFFITLLIIVLVEALIPSLLILTSQTVQQLPSIDYHFVCFPCKQVTFFLEIHELNNIALYFVYCVMLRSLGFYCVLPKNVSALNLAQAKLLKLKIKKTPSPLGLVMLHKCQLGLFLCFPMHSWFRGQPKLFTLIHRICGFSLLPLAFPVSGDSGCSRLHSLVVLAAFLWSFSPLVQLW